MSIKTFDLKEAAAFLKMTPEGLRRKVVCGEVPGAKPGRRWCFREDDLAEYLRSLYPEPIRTSCGVEPIRRATWRSTKEIISGGFQSPSVDKEYRKLLERRIK